jgi:hypothetical protein
MERPHPYLIVQLAKLYWLITQLLSIIYIFIYPISLLDSLAITCSATTLKINPNAITITTTGSTRKPEASSVYSFKIVFEDPPAPADRVEVGRSLALAACRSWFARRLVSLYLQVKRHSTHRIADLGPPGTVLAVDALLDTIMLIILSIIPFFSF